MRKDTDQNLILGIKAGNTRCFDKLFLKYYPRFRVFVMRFVRNEAATEDILQNIFLKLWLKREQMDETLSMVAYLYVFAKYEISNYLRSVSSHRQEPLVESLHEGRVLAPGADTEYDYRELSRRVDAVIEAMPPQRRRIFVMNRYEFKTAREIADVLGLSVRTVEKHIELALRSIRTAVRPVMCILSLIGCPGL